MFDFATTRQRKIVTKTQTTHNVISLVRGVRSFSSLYIIMCSVVLLKQKYFGHMLSVIILRLNLISLGKLVLLIRQNWRLSATLNCQDIRSVKNKFRRNRIFFHNSVLCLPSFMSLWCQYILLCKLFSLRQSQPGFVKIFFFYFYLGMKTVGFLSAESFF